MDLKTLKMDPFMNDETSLASKPSTFELAINNDINEEKNPWKQNTIVTKQLFQSTLGGSVQFVDRTGGTVILSYDPATGTITLNGGVNVGQSVTIGTLTSVRFISGTVASSLFSNGTITTSSFTGTINNSTVGTPSITGGTFETPIINGGTLGTATLLAPNINGTANFPINAGSPALGASGAFEIQTRNGTAQIALRSGTNTWYFLPTGTQ